MRRRDLLRAAALALSKPSFTYAQGNRWRTFEVRTRVEIPNTAGPVRVWLPAALTGATPYQRTLSNRFAVEGATARIAEVREDRLGIVAAAFPAGVRPTITLTSRVATRDHSVDLTRNPGKTSREDPAVLAHFLRPTHLLPTDGIVQATALQITGGAKTDLAKARAIYEWIVDNTFRNPKTRGCGTGDIRFMLESRDLGGKCADLNALFVGLARAASLPARDVYGIRVAKSELGYKSLGVATEIVTKAQHCRAEVYLTGYGWVPVDPADVRKVALEEPPEMLRSARTRLFGSWEMNWMALNFAHDVALPGSAGAPLGFLMYPQAETAEGRLDSLAPDDFRYEITAKEIPAS